MVVVVTVAPPDAVAVAVDFLVGAWVVAVPVGLVAAACVGA